MNLATYFRQTGLNKAAFAREIGVSNAMLYQYENNLRPVPAKYCPAIERASAGLVTRQDLHPDDWQQIWPELIQQGGRRKDDVSAPGVHVPEGDHG